MNLEFSKLPEDISLIRLQGNLDIAGVGAAETRFYAYCAGSPPRVLVDLSGIGFIASLGIRMVLQAIKTTSARGGKLLLLNPASAVASALDIAGLGGFIHRGSEAEASVALLNSK
jgi:anti-anti-sigma factor